MPRPRHIVLELKKGTEQVLREIPVSPRTRRAVKHLRRLRSDALARSGANADGEQVYYVLADYKRPQ